MEIKNLILRGSAYLDIDIFNIDVRQDAINDWFNDCLTCVHGIFGDSNFYRTFKDKWVNIFGFESKPINGDDIYDTDKLSLAEEMHVRVLDSKYRIQALINELNKLA